MIVSRYILSLLFFFSTILNAQQEFGKSFVDVFASDEFHGRGYVNNGNKKAADYLAEQYARFGLKPIRSSYFQEFSFNVNTFPENLIVAIKGDTLETGIDYLVDPRSGSSKGEFECYYLNFSNIPQEPVKNKNTVFVIDPTITSNPDSIVLLQRIRYYLSSEYPVVFLNNGKLTWSVSTEQGKHAILEIKKSAFGKPKTIYLDVQNKFIRHYPTQNVIGKIKGKKKNKFIVVSAHYDHLGMMGNATFNGANDNASGVAMMLYLASYFADHKPKYSIVFMAFGGEEVGLKGSKHYVDNPLFPLKKIKFLLNLDLNGTGEDGATVVNGTLHKKEFLQLTEINNEQELLKKIKVRGPAANSDHYWFTHKGVPAFFLYTLGGVSNYHDVNDRPETLPLTEFNDLSKLLIDFVKSF